MNDGTTLSSSDSGTVSKEKKSFRSMFEKKRKCIVIILKPRMMHFLRIGKKDLLLYQGH